MKAAIRTLGIFLLALSALVPPWQSVHTLNGEKKTASAGYHPLWNPPAGELALPEGATDPGYKINVVRLSIQMVALLLAMNAGLALSGTKKG